MKMRSLDFILISIYAILGVYSISHILVIKREKVIFYFSSRMQMFFLIHDDKEKVNVIDIFNISDN